MFEEFLNTLKNRRVMGILIFLPIIYTIIFGGLFYKNLVTGVPIIVVNLDDGTSGEKLLLNLRDTPEIDVVEVGGAADEITLRMLDAGASGAVVIPKNYSQKISRGESVAVELIIDNTNTILGGVVTRAVQSVISTTSAEILATQRIAAGWDTYSAENSFLTLSTRIFYNPTSGYSDFFLTVLILHSLQIAIVFAIAPALVEEKFSRRELFDKPTKILAEKIFIFVILEVTITSICLALGIKFFGLVCRGSFWEIILIVAAFAFAMTGFALAAGAFFSVPYHTINYTLAYVMPSVLFTGAIWPRFSMDDLSLFFSYIMPIGWAANDLRNLFLKGVSVGWESHAIILILFGLIFFAAAVIKLKLSESPKENSLRITNYALRIIRERLPIFIVLMFASSAYALLIGNLYAGQIVQNIPVAVCDLDGSALSRELTRTISETDQFIFTENLSSEVEAVEKLERGKAVAVLVVPENFSQNFYSHKPTELAFLEDGANIVPVNYSSTPINLVVGNFTAQYNQLAAISHATPTLSPAPISMSLRMDGNNVQGYLEFYIYGVMLMAANVGVALAFGFSIQAEKINSLKRLLAKEIFYLSLSLFSVIIGIFLLEKLFAMPFRGEIWQMLLICAVFLFAMQNLAGLLGLFFKTSLALVQAIVFYTLPALLTAGYIWPYAGMTDAMKFLSAVQPVHYALADFRRLALTGADNLLWQHCGILFLVGLAAMTLILLGSDSLSKKK